MERVEKNKHRHQQKGANQQIHLHNSKQIFDMK